MIDDSDCFRIHSTPTPDKDYCLEYFRKAWIGALSSASLPITRRQISDSSKLKEFADDNFIFDENGSKLSKQVENIVRKEKLLIMSNFSFSHSVLFPQCFQKACFPGASKEWEWVNWNIVENTINDKSIIIINAIMKLLQFLQVYKLDWWWGEKGVTSLFVYDQIINYFTFL